MDNGDNGDGEKTRGKTGEIRGFRVVCENNKGGNEDRKIRRS